MLIACSFTLPIFFLSFLFRINMQEFFICSDQNTVLILYVENNSICAVVCLFTFSPMCFVIQKF